MIDFVEQCQREWRRLGVPEPVANEMAADLNADLAEAERDGVWPEEFLGNAAFDPRSLAADWARERGIVTTAQPARSNRHWWPVALSLLALVLAAAAATVRFARFDHSTSAPAPASTAATPARASRTVLVPDLAGLHEELAIQLAKNAGLQVRVGHPRLAGNPQQAPGTVLRQSPPPGSVVRRGATLQLIVTWPRRPATKTTHTSH